MASSFVKYNVRLRLRLRPNKHKRGSVTQVVSQQTKEKKKSVTQDRQCIKLVITYRNKLSDNLRVTSNKNCLSSAVYASVFIDGRDVFRDHRPWILGLIIGRSAYAFLGGVVSGGQLSNSRFVADKQLFCLFVNRLFEDLISLFLLNMLGTFI